MKKLIGVLGIFALAWLASYMQQNDVPRKAWAGITCTLPVILQNNTTADATQVMQNFNQLAGCFNNVATVSQVTCGPGLDGGIISSTGTCSLSAARRTNPTVQSFLGGSGTYTTPTNVLWIEVYMVGGGGGGGPSLSVASGPTAGGNTTFGTATANGGSGGSVGNGGAGVAPSGCTAGGPGGVGGTGSQSSTAENGSGGSGGVSYFGGGASGGIASFGSNATGNSGGGGGGGGGVTGTPANGGGGGAGGAYCYLIVNNPAPTIAFAVGGPGTGGVANAGGTAGGNGGSGAIYVIEHYN